MEETRIQLTFNRNDFEEIYFRDNQGNIFFSKNIKQLFLFFLLSALAFVAVIIYDMYANTFLSISILLFFLCISTAFFYLRAAAIILKRKNGIRAYLDSIEKYHQFQLILTDTTISVRMDDEERIEKWSAVRNAIIRDDFISLDSGLRHFYPRKAMSADDYELLKTFVLKAIKKQA